jgi:Zn-dependent protease/predicted transcriptional regulator
VFLIAGKSASGSGEPQMRAAPDCGTARGPDIGIVQSAREVAMRSSFKLGRVFGIEIGIHYSWVFAFLLIAWSLAAGFFPARYQGWSPSMYWLVGVVSTLGLFASVLVHELSHSLVARARGQGVHSITLFIFGGVSNLAGEAERPLGEFLVSVVGPLTSFALAALSWVVLRLLSPGASPVGATLEYLAFINVLLGVFNLLPGFPLDGGRVLRSAIWAATGSLERATNVASYVGQGFGLLLIFLGVAQVLSGNFLGGMWIAFIGWFLNGAAEATRHDALLRAGLRGAHVADLMSRDLPVASPDMTVEELVFEHTLRRGRRALLVMDGRELLGIVSITDIRELPREEWARTPVARIMTSVPLKTVAADADLEQSLRLLGDGTVNQLPVMEGGRPVGLLSRSDVLRFVSLRAALGLDLAAHRA